MCFHIAYGAWLDIGVCQCFDDDFGLAVNARSRVSYLEGTVIVYGRTFDDGMDQVSIPQGRIQFFQDYNPYSAGKNCPFGVLIERPTVAVRGNDAPLDVFITVAQLQVDGDSPCQSHFAFAAKNALARVMHSNQRG